MSQIRFIFALHNHQPIGNFEHLFEQSYQESYLPFLDVFSQYPALKLTLHTSGSLMEWLETAHPEYVDRLSKLVSENRIEIVGGPFFEPILAMLPTHDRIGQIRKYTDWIKKNLGAEVHGIWTPERVWEQSYVRDLVEAGIKYTILDDCHFKNAGLSENALWKHYITEDDGKTMFIFPGAERLRYLIPFRNVEDAIDFFRKQAEQNDNAVFVHGDDGEKFGSWPNTSGTVFGERWLHRFCQALCDNADWLITTTPYEVITSVPPLGTVYLPDGSYREMTEWVLPPDRQLDLARISKEMESDVRWETLRKFVRGGFWRNFKVRYPESNEMYARMMYTSSKINATPSADVSCINNLYRGQCNCGYWHGAFGGVYLPHLRNAVFHELIEADKKLDEAAHQNESWVDEEVADFNFDSHNEVKLTNEHLAVWTAPFSGGIIYELDLKSISHNILATMTRKPEAYHKLVFQAANDSNTVDCNGNRVVLKQQGLDRQIQYDWYPRKSLVDLFYDAETDFGAVRSGNVHQHGSFVNAVYEPIIRKKPGKIQLFMESEGTAYGAAIRIQKGITLTAGSKTLEIAYRLENLPRDYRMHFAVELNFAGLPGGAEDRYFSMRQGPKVEKLGNLSTNLDLYSASNLSLIDEWLGVDASIAFSKPTNIYAFPIESVSQSEGGFELVHQSVCVQPHWILEPDANGTWTVEFELGF
ncbi:MAG: alpha-amylase/4-alpha-glucanotransferase domain-containing protein [Thermoguttaceae bacterium]